MKRKMEGKKEKIKEIHFSLKKRNKKKGISLILTVLEMYIDAFCGFLCHYLEVVVESSEQWTLPPTQLTFYP